MGKTYNEEPFQFFLSDHLLLPSLNSPEMDFLPIWANGLDDGSGGVFQDTIPPAEMGPSEPGPAYHTGHTIPTTGTRTAGTGTRDGNEGDDSTMMGDDDRFAGSIYGVSELGDNLDRFEIISARSAQTATTETATVPNSLDAQRSVATTSAASSTGGVGSGLGRLNLDPGGPNRHRVVAVPSSTYSFSDISAESSEEFSLNSKEDGEYADAGYTQPAEHQAVGRALDNIMNVDANDGTNVRSGTVRGTTITTAGSAAGWGTRRTIAGNTAGWGSATVPTTGTTSGNSNNNNNGGGGGSLETDNFMLDDDDQDGGLRDLDDDCSSVGSSTIGADSDFDMI